jgi:hypothetical protein
MHQFYVFPAQQIKYELLAQIWWSPPNHRIVTDADEEFTKKYRGRGIFTRQLKVFNPR